MPYLLVERIGRTKQVTYQLLEIYFAIIFLTRILPASNIISISLRLRVTVTPFDNIATDRCHSACSSNTLRSTKRNRK
jgi:hypothetical protein